MFKTKVNSEELNSSKGHGYTISIGQMESLVGRVLNLIEALGLNEKQEKAIKDVIKKEIWDTTNGLTLITGHLLTLTEQISLKIEKEQNVRFVEEEKCSEGLLCQRCINGKFEISFEEVGE